MNKLDIRHHKLTDFIPIAESMGIKFPQYTHQCGAIRFVEFTREFDRNICECVCNYKFKNEYTVSGMFFCLPLFVLWIPGISYLLYDKDLEINVWVCYTEKECRNQGYIKILLAELKNMYQGTKIIIDTNDPTLRKYIQEFGFELFQK